MSQNTKYKQGKKDIRDSQDIRYSQKYYDILDKINNYRYRTEIIQLPNWQEYLDDIRQIVIDNWNLPNISKSSTINSDKPNLDLWNQTNLAMSPISVNRTTSLEMDRQILNDVATEFNVIYFFNKGDTRVNFIHLVVESLKVFFDEIKSRLNLTDDNLNFILKGGIVMRIFIRELIRGFVKEVEDYILQELSDKIKLSDYDFEVISNNIDDATYNRINILSYLVCLKIRNYLQDSDFLDFFQMRDQTKITKLSKLKEALQIVVNNLPKTNKYYGIQIDRIEIDDTVGVGDFDGIRQDYLTASHFNYKRDYAVIVDLKNQQPCYLINSVDMLKVYGMSQKYLNLCQSNNNLYATYNPVISNYDTAKLNRFQLNRIKYRYFIFFQKNGFKFHDHISGEVLDLSHNHATSHNKNSFSLRFSQSPKLATYQLYQYRLSFLTYSHYGIIDDLLNIMFTENNHQPWNIKKYTKRLYRLIYITVLSYMSAPKFNNDYSDLMQRRNDSHSTGLYSKKIKLLKCLYQSILNDKIYTGVAICNYLKRDIFLGRFINAFLLSYQQNGNSQEFQEFKNNVLEILGTLIELLIINSHKVLANVLIDNPISVDVLNGGSIQPPLKRR